MNCTTLSLGLILFLTTSDAPLDAARAPVAEPLAQTDDEDSVAQDVEVMRTLLVKSIDASGGMSVNEFKDVSGIMSPGSIYISNLAGDLVQGPPILVTHSRGFRVPGTGVIYSMDVQIPARAIAEVSAAEPQTRMDGADEWEAAARVVRGDPAAATGTEEEAPGQSPHRKVRVTFPSFTFYGQHDWELDPDALDEVIDAVLGTLARHGARIGGLTGGESITVALRVTANSSAGSNSWFPAVGNIEQVAVRDFWNAAAANQGRADLERTIVMQLSRQILDELADSKTEGVDLRDRALVHTY